MRPATSKSRWFAAATCMLITSMVCAEEGVVRLSDQDNDSDGAGVVRLGTPKAKQPVRTSLAPPNSRAYYQSRAYSPQDHFAMYAQMYGVKTPGIRPVSFSSPQLSPAYRASAMTQPAELYSQTSFAPQCGTNGCGMGYVDGYGSGCSDGGCDMGCGDSSCGEGCNNRSRRKGRRGRKGECDGWGDCEDICYGDGYEQRLGLLTRALPKGSCGGRKWPCRWWRGQQLNYHTRNQRLANHLFGWMIPSGCSGQGCPPVGCYNITYADEPSYTDPRDQQLYGAQGSGVPNTVPLAPNVRYAYNYSWGTPSSRLTQIGQYDPQTSPQPLYRQTW